MFKDTGKHLKFKWSHFPEWLCRKRDLLCFSIRLYLSVLSKYLQIWNLTRTLGEKRFRPYLYSQVKPRREATLQIICDCNKGQFYLITQNVASVLCFWIWRQSFLQHFYAFEYGGNPFSNFYMHLKKQTQKLK